MTTLYAQEVANRLDEVAKSNSQKYQKAKPFPHIVTASRRASAGAGVSTTDTSSKPTLCTTRCAWTAKRSGVPAIPSTRRATGSNIPNRCSATARRKGGATSAAAWPILSRTT